MRLPAAGGNSPSGLIHLGNSAEPRHGLCLRHYEEVRDPATTYRSPLSPAKSHSPVRAHSAVGGATQPVVAPRQWERSKHQLQWIVPPGTETPQDLRVARS